MPIRPSEIFESFSFTLDGACSCGRLMNVVHCPKCGSSSVVVLKRLTKGNTALLPNGTRIPERVFNCKQCATNFPESTCFRACTALPLTWSRESEIVDKITKTTTLSQEGMDALRHLAKNPKYAAQIKAKLGSQGLLETVNKEQTQKTNESESLSKLFSPPVLDRDGEE